MDGILYLVATPIGNLGDITQRAIEVLKSVDFILAEDTRTSLRVLQHHDIHTPFFSSVYQGAERQRIPSILSLLGDGKHLALVSDAGTPLISDPGFPTVCAVVDSGHAVVPVPGPCAAIAGLIASGLPLDRFSFEGALPRGRGARQSPVYIVGIQRGNMCVLRVAPPHSGFTPVAGRDPSHKKAGSGARTDQGARAILAWNRLGTAQLLGRGGSCTRGIRSDRGRSRNLSNRRSRNDPSGAQRTQGREPSQQVHRPNLGQWTRNTSQRGLPSRPLRRRVAKYICRPPQRQHTHGV